MRILVVDDHEVVRRGICSVLATETTLTICGEAIDGQDAVEKAAKLRPDVVIMDISMPRMNGLEATREIKNLLPETDIIVVSQHDAPEMVRQAYHAGARAYVVKSAVSKDLLAAIAKVNKHAPPVQAEALADQDPHLDPQEILQRSAAFEEALRTSEERFRSAMNNLAEGLYTLDTQGLVTYVNPSAEAMFGWRSADLLGKKMHDITHYKHPDGTAFPAADCPGLQVLQRGIVLREHEDMFIHRDGSFFPVVFSASPLKLRGEIAGVVVSFRDDTNRRQTEESLRQSERIYRAIGESIDYGIWICDSNGQNIYASPSFLKMIGLTQQQCSNLGWAHALHPEEVDATVAAWKECVRQGGLWEREHRFRGADGSLHYVLARGVPIRDDQGRILYWAGLNLDIHEIRKSEERLRGLADSLESQIQVRTGELKQRNTEILQQSEQLRELSNRLLQIQDEERRRIARELHDGVGQLLAASSMNFANLKNEYFKLGPEARRALEENAQIIEQASQEIRTMSHLLHPPLLDEVGLESALDWYVDGFAERSKIDVQLRLAKGFSQGLPRELALALFRIVQECLTNVHRHSGSLTALVAIARSSNEIRLEVADAGRGIPAEIMSSVSTGESSGVGLRGMKERVGQFGGRLEVHSNQGGTKIVAILPLHEMQPTQDQETEEISDQDLQNAQVTSLQPVQDTMTILCIDDEPAGLLPRKLLLESAGYRVLEARSGAEGIRLFQSERIDAVILDYWMSGMKGTAVASELKRINPAVPIVVLSGMSDLPGEAAGLVDQWLVKGSHRAEQLLDSIGTLLERRTA